MVLANLTKDVSFLFIGGAEGLKPGATVVRTQRGYDMLRQLVGGIAKTDAAIQEFGAKLATKEPVEFLGGQVDVIVQHLVNEGINLLETLFLGLELERSLTFTTSLPLKTALVLWSTIK